MAHEFESGFFTKHAAWHTLGTVLPEAPDTGTAYGASGLVWAVEKKPLVMQDGLRETSMNALVRDSDQSILGYGSDKYSVFQNKEAFDWMAPFVESGYFKWEAAGSLKGGKQCWTLLKMQEREIIKRDILKDYLLMTWGHDGSTPIQALDTTIRVVCMNTLRMALRDSGYNVKHVAGSKNKLLAVQNIYMESIKAFERQTALFERMIKRPVTPEEQRGYINLVFPITDDMTQRQKNRVVSMRTFIGDLADGSASGLDEIQMIKGTAYSLYMAFSEANEHFFGNGRVKDRGANILSGQAQERDGRACNLMYELVLDPIGKNKFATAGVA